MRPRQRLRKKAQSAPKQLDALTTQGPITFGQKNKSPAKKQSLVLEKVLSYSSAESACSASASSSSTAAETSSDSTSSVPGTMASSGFSPLIPHRKSVVEGKGGGMRVAGGT